MGDTNVSTLVLVCDLCRHSEPAEPVIFPGFKPGGDWLASGRWPTHCDQPMRLANTTDRDGTALQVEFPYEGELGA